MNKKELQLMEEHSDEIKNLRADFQKFFSIAKTLLPELAETRTLQRLVNNKEECRKRNSELV